MSNNPDRYRDMDLELIDADRAADELQAIIDDKLELRTYLNGSRIVHRLNKSQMADMREQMESAFDEAHASHWNEHLGKATGDWPVRIPPFETLDFVTPKQRADREWAKKNRPASTNAATLDVIDAGRHHRKDRGAA